MTHNHITTCRFCGTWEGDLPKVKYAVRHYAHHGCYLRAGKKLSDLHPWQVRLFPYGLLKDHGLLDEAYIIGGAI